MVSMLEAAVDLGQRGFRVHPCRPEDKRPYTRWTHTATTDADSIAAMWRRHPDALIAIRTGDGLVVVDDDRGRPQPDPSLPPTLVARTRSRGWHYYYRCHTPVGNAVGILPGIDLRGENGYVIAPPSPGWEWHWGLLDGWASAPMLPELFKVAAARLNNERAGRRFEVREHVPAGERHDYLVRYAGWAAQEMDLTDTEALTEEIFEHALTVCEPWPADHLRTVRRNLRKMARWVLEVEARG